MDRSRGAPRRGTANLPAERIAAVSPAPGRLDVFAAGAGNHLWHWSKLATAAWGPAEDLGGNLPAEGVSAVSWGPNRIDVFAASRGPGNPLQHWWWDGAGFAGPRSLGGSLVHGTVSAVSHAANRLDVFGVAGDRRHRSLAMGRPAMDGSQPPRRPRTRWRVSAVMRRAVIPAARIAGSRHRLDVFVAGSGNTLRQWPGGGLENATTAPVDQLAHEPREEPGRRSTCGQTASRNS